MENEFENMNAAAPESSGETGSSEIFESAGGEKFEVKEVDVKEAARWLVHSFLSDYYAGSFSGKDAEQRYAEHVAAGNGDLQSLPIEHELFEDTLARLVEEGALVKEPTNNPTDETRYHFAGQA